MKSFFGFVWLCVVELVVLLFAMGATGIWSFLCWIGAVCGALTIAVSIFLALQPKR